MKKLVRNYKKKSMVKKYLISNRFDFLDRFFSRVFFIIPYELFSYVLVKNRMVKNESVMLLSQNGKNELLKGGNTCTYRF